MNDDDWADRVWDRAHREQPLWTWADDALWLALLLLICAVVVALG